MAVLRHLGLSSDTRVKTVTLCSPLQQHQTFPFGPWLALPTPLIPPSPLSSPPRSLVRPLAIQNSRTRLYFSYNVSERPLLRHHLFFPTALFLTILKIAINVIPAGIGNIAMRSTTLK